MNQSNRHENAAAAGQPSFPWRAMSLISFALLFCTCSAIFLAACGKREEMAERKPLVVASFFPLYDFAREIGGSNVEVRCLVPPGGDPHAAEPTPSSAQAVVQSDLVLLLGLGMDRWVEKLAATEGKTRVATINDGIPVRHMGKAALAEFSSGTPDASEIDPHVWLDPVLAETLAQHITTQLVKLVPDHREEIEARGSAFIGELQKLDRDFSNTCARLPSRRVVTFHGAFGYLFSRYRLEMAGVIEEFPGTEPSAAYLRQLVDLMRTLKIKVILAEPQLPDRPAQIIAQEIGGRVERLDPCETILPDAPQATYLERQRKNLETLRVALNAP